MKVSQAARVRIAAAPEELGCRRNGGAIGTFQIGGLLHSTMPGKSTLPQNLWEAMQDELTAHDLHLIVQKLPDAWPTEAVFVHKMLREWMGDGLLIDYTHSIPARLRELIRENNTPAVWINAKLSSDCFHPDDFEARKQAIEKLVALEHRQHRICLSSR